MPNEISREAFAEYEALNAKVDGFQARVRERYPGQIECRAGCSECCRRIPRLILSPVEAFYLREQFRQLPTEEQARLREASRTAMPPCPILTDEACGLHRNRPLLCRTYGYPTLSPELLKIGEPALNYCYKNFTGLTGPNTLDQDCVMNVDRVTQELWEINARFVRARWGVAFDRSMAFTVQEVLQGVLDTWSPAGSRRAAGTGGSGGGTAGGSRP
ncbi:MAG: YkgJ family cysteine cluster protein [candidate division NC10 bacterium]|nr:YkgJ family cysteine cluster protein [candidate division NC10 bacterium]MBI4841851.1 YkgJ family cysteine cluster protein [candidate division NC10 bacterium]